MGLAFIPMPLLIVSAFKSTRKPSPNCKTNMPQASTGRCRAAEVRADTKKPEHFRLFHIMFDICSPLFYLLSIAFLYRVFTCYYDSFCFELVAFTPKLSMATIAGLEHPLHQVIFSDLLTCHPTSLRVEPQAMVPVKRKGGCHERAEY